MLTWPPCPDSLEVRRLPSGRGGERGRHLLILAVILDPAGISVLGLPGGPLRAGGGGPWSTGQLSAGTQGSSPFKTAQTGPSPRGSLSPTAELSSGLSAVPMYCQVLLGMQFCMPKAQPASPPVCAFAQAPSAVNIYLRSVQPASVPAWPGPSPGHQGGALKSEALKESLSSKERMGCQALCPPELVPLEHTPAPSGPCFPICAALGCDQGPACCVCQAPT